VGTSISLKNLFYNTPARRKFLKTPSTEFKHIFDAVQRVAIAHPERAVTLRSDDEVLLQLRASEHHRRIADVFGEKAASGVFAFRDAAGPVTISGFLCRPDFARKSRVEQYLFLNRRPIVSKSLQHAVFQAYENLLEKGSFPFFVLFLELDPSAVDVNVHPAKSEVKFEDESSMYRFVLSSVRAALSEQNLVPALSVREDASRAAAPAQGVRFQTTGGEGGARTYDWNALIEPGKEATGRVSERLDAGLFSSPMLPTAQQAPGSPGPEQPPTTAPIWQVHNKYIILATGQGLLVIDQHAAHERVLYERAVGRFAETHNKSQQLLFPHTLECSPGDAALIQQLIPDLESIGFSVRLFGKNAVIVDGVPVDVKPGEEGRILPQILDLFKEDEQSVELQPREKLAKSYSCRAAVKAGDPLSEPEMRALIASLFEAEIPFVCPHGRPVMVTLSLSELDRRFGRTS
jgi:DNA mismatch repair protein MutL